MKNGRYSDAQIMSILKPAEGGVPVSELCREHGMSSVRFYKWWAKFGGMDASMVSDLKHPSNRDEPQSNPMGIPRFSVHARRFIYWVGFPY